MKRYLVIAVVLGLVAGSLAGPATAAKKKKKAAKPVATTMYMHGENPLGELDGVQWFNDGAGSRSTMTLDGEEPSGSTKSMNFFAPVLNDQCTGLPLAFPTFDGDMVGTIKGDAKMFLNFASAPGEIVARIWADVPVFSCNDGYIEPDSEVLVDVPAGSNEVEVVFEDLDLKVNAWVLVEVLALSGTDYRGQVGRLLYDSPDAPSRLEFKCIPASGTSCLP